MNPNDLKTVITSTSSQFPLVVTVVYHPKNDLNNTTEKRCELAPGGKISVSYLKDVFNLRVVEKCSEDGSNPVGIPFDTSTGDSRNPIQLATDGKFHITGEPLVASIVNHSPFKKTSSDEDIIMENNLKMNTLDGVIEFIKYKIEKECGNRLNPQGNDASFSNNLLEWQICRRFTSYTFDNEDDVKVLLAVSGAGKTRLLLETLYQHRGYYFVASLASVGFGSGDLLKCKDVCEKYSGDMEQVRNYIQLLVFCRAVICNYLIEKGFNDPKQLLLAQIHPLAFFGIDVFQEVFTHLLWLDFSSFQSYSNYFDLIAIDEIQHTVENSDYVFKLPHSANSRPFFSPIIYLLKTFGKFPKFIISGTGINFNLLDEMLSSMTAKPEQVFKHCLLDNLKPLQRDEVIMYARTILEEHTIPEAEIENVCTSIGNFEHCFGRARFSAWFLEQYLSIRDVDKCIDKFMKEIVNVNSQIFPLRFLKDSTRRDNSVLNRAMDGEFLSSVLERCIVNYIIYGDGSATLNSDNALLAVRFGIGFCKFDNGVHWKLTICEPAVLHCIREFIPFQNIARKLANDLENRREPQIIGSLMEYVVAFALVANVGNLIDVRALKPSVTDLYRYIADQNNEERNRVCFPEPVCGPDVVYIRNNVCYIVQVKFVSRFEKQLRIHAEQTTDPDYFYWNKKKKCVRKEFEQKQVAVKELLRRYTVKRVVVVVTKTKTREGIENAEVIDRNSHPRFFDTLHPKLWDLLENLQERYQQ
jgi:hypothetical protein